MTPAELSRTVLRSVRGAVEEQELSVPVPARIVVQPPPRPGCGDYASNVALQLARQAGRPAREVAEILRKRLIGSAGITRVEIAGPGFLNFTLGDGAQAALVREVLAQGDRYGDRSARGVGAGDVAGPGSSPDRVPAPDPAPYRGPDTGPAPSARDVVVAEVLARIQAAAGAAAVDGGQVAPVATPPDLTALIARLGVDEARWVLLRPAAQDPVRVPERPVQRESNPRFRVQYAAARARALGRYAQELGFGSEPGDVGAPVRGEAVGEGPADGSRSAAQNLQTFHTLLATYPSAIEAAARLRAPDRVVRHLEATADAFFRWHDVCPPLPVGEQKPLAVHRARLALAEAGGTVLANGLRLLGISAPEHL
ncbi:ArgS-related anticodon-binding protein NrtL [Streptomyces sp. Isolate_219]|uniref:ArgS-related anticodon-binding protein NrtL n=1 Tax=Streptomyces sp. Isolate_219 TaxID=2950110 RepID=UPI0021C60D25|nr:DALR anticodon-binding domain-containing protein [Streptomyces sp. Isolate_219]MCR8574952.1 DALR anticodon-binding domain-containing protein [Streptomyces sp. Isolate_219]